MSYVIKATRRWGKNKMVRYYGDSSWHKGLFDSKVKSYEPKSKADRALKMISDKTFNDLDGPKTRWKIEICSLKKRVSDNELKCFYREFIKKTSKRTGLKEETIRKRYKELVGSK